MVNKVNIEIYGTHYPITTNEDPHYVRKLADEIDTSVRSIMRGNSGVSTNQALVLLNLNYLDSSIKAEQGADRLREQVAEYLEESAKANMELSEARGEIDRLNRELEKTKRQLEDAKKNQNR